MPKPSAFRRCTAAPAWRAPPPSHSSGRLAAARLGQCVERGRALLRPPAAATGRRHGHQRLLDVDGDLHADRAGGRRRGHLHGLLERGQAVSALHAKGGLGDATSMVSWSGASWM
jgi:hypothetical protein